MAARHQVVPRGSPALALWYDVIERQLRFRTKTGRARFIKFSISTGHECACARAFVAQSVFLRAYALRRTHRDLRTGAAVDDSILDRPLGPSGVDSVHAAYCLRGRTRLEFCTFTSVLSPIPQRVGGFFECVHPERGR
jgi:hypothetical protein